MSQEEADPILITEPLSLDADLVTLVVRSPDNGPRSPDNGLNIEGEVSFGVVGRMSPAGRRYEIGIRGAMLRAFGEGCHFSFNSDIEQVLQTGVVKQTDQRTGEKKLAASASGEVGAKINLLGWVLPNIGIKAALSGLTKSEQIDKFSINQSIFVSQVWAGGVRLGHSDLGDPRNPAYGNALTGRFVNGAIGYMHPYQGVREYCVYFNVSTWEGGLTVRLNKGGWSSDGSANPEQKEAFATLKQKVAEWVLNDMVASQVKKVSPDGYDQQSGEILIASASVTVNLSVVSENRLVSPPASENRLLLPASHAASHGDASRARVKRSASSRAKNKMSFEGRDNEKE